MQSPNRAYVAELDQLRACAALLVFFYHTVHTGRTAAGLSGWPAANPVSALLIEGHTGVALFMVLSGFVLARGVLDQPLDYRQFITNRLLRIFPLMVFVLAFAIYGNTDVTLSGIVAPFLLLSNTTPRLFTDVTNISGTVWTIAVEFQFYLIAPFIFAFAARRGLRWLIGIMVLAWLCKAIVLLAHNIALEPQARHMISYYTIVGRLNQFLFGVGLACIWPQLEERVKDRRWHWAILTIGVLSVCGFAWLVNLSGGGGGTWSGWFLLRQEIEGLTWEILIAGFVLTKPFGKSLIARVLCWIGLISFSMYIFHWPLEHVFWTTLRVQKLVPSAPSIELLLIYAVVLLPFVIAMSWLSYITIEKPFLDMRRRYVVPAGVSEMPRQAA